MEKIKFGNTTVLDMGSGTGILAILAKKVGSTAVDAIDIEEWAFENMKENFERNEVQVNAYFGGVGVLQSLSENYEVIIANINKNILLSQFAVYNQKLKNKGDLLLSGFYEVDADDLLQAPELNGYSELNRIIKDGWCALHLKKNG